MGGGDAGAAGAEPAARERGAGEDTERRARIAHRHDQSRRDQGTMAEPIRGIDVSEYQTGLEWARVRADGAQFGIAKCTEGTAGVDGACAAHWKGMKATGMPRGLYSFSRWDRGTDPVAEAQWFLGHMPALEAGDFLALDIEASPDKVAGYELSAWALAWLVTVERAVGFRPLVYSGFSFAQSFLTDPLLATYGLWVADYGPPSAPAPVGPWPMVAMWQRGQAPWGGQSVDDNLFFGSAEQLRAYGKPATAPVPAPHKPAGRGGPRFEILVPMMARSQPDLSSVLWQGGKPLMVNKGAVLNGTGQQTPHWVQCDDAGQKVWLLLKNTKPV